MNPLGRVSLVVSFMAGALAAQHFLGVGSEPRRTTRASWLGLSGHQNVAVDFAQPQWRPEYEATVKERTAGPFLLGKGELTTLRTDVELVFGPGKLARGRWYVTARRDAEQAWSLALFAADRADASGRVVAHVLNAAPDLSVPVRITREAESVDLFEVTLTESRGTPHNLVLAMAWGPHRLRTEVAAAFDTKLPAGAPAFALTPAGKGTKTPSGLVYEQLRAGSGASPGPTDRMHVHYAGWLADGTLLESSHVRGEPGVLRSEWVVKGLAEGLQLMQPGSTFRFTIRPELAYGKEGNGRVPPDSTLVYEVTLLGSDKL